jgi:hypothetical protein
MKKFFFTLLLFSWFTSVCIAQDSIPCNRFQVDSVWLVQAGINRLMVKLRFSGIQAEFINYPYFPLIMNQFGDTIATGELLYFGQAGNSSQVYSAMTMLNELPPVIYLRFRYDNDSCNFVFVTVGLAESEKPQEPGFYPNPVKDRIFLQNPAESGAYEILDKLGRRMNAGKAESGGVIPATGLPPGIYFLKTGNISYKFLKTE